MANGIIQTLLLAITPIGELRAAIPVGILVYKLNWLLVFCLAVSANILVAIPLLLFLRPVSKWLCRRSKIAKLIFEKSIERVRLRTKYSIRKYGAVGLMTFVAFPLPGTGAWAGSLVAYIFDIPFKRAFPAIAIGVLTAGILVSAATSAGISIEKYFGWLTLLITIVIAILAFFAKTIKKFILKFKI